MRWSTQPAPVTVSIICSLQFKRFPTGSCVNPANTIQAVALWIGQHIIERAQPHDGLPLILDRMLPSDADRNLPSFGMLEIDLSHHFTKSEFDLADNMAGPDKPISDINALLKLIRADLPDFAQKLAEKALTLYFTIDTVTAALQNGRSTLSHMSDRLP